MRNIDIGCLVRNTDLHKAITSCVKTAKHKILRKINILPRAVLSR